ncbi:HepT-like ribonuclease domain-containing protein, partial [Echinicola sediminis]
MDERILKWLYDVKIAIDEIESYFEDREKDFLKYRENLMLKRAVERDLEIIGEAINRILKKDDSFEKIITNAKSIIGLRNQVIHGYDTISDENIWSIIIYHIPKLKKEVEKL